MKYTSPKRKTEKTEAASGWSVLPNKQEKIIQAERQRYGTSISQNLFRKDFMSFLKWYCEK